MYAFYSRSVATLVEPEIGRFTVEVKAVTVLEALRQMWGLLGDEKWICYTAFGALTVAALLEISMPGIITASIFSAQNGDTLVFYRNSRILVLLCLTSGICSGLRSGCFAIANMILVKRLRKTVYSSLLLQDISFFDREAVGDLTSRIGTDCQRLSHTMANDIHMILRNILQGTGALINLMTLSWPLALSSLVICSILSAIFLIYGQYQKKAAMLAQDFVASANEVAQESLSSMRTIRAYGTEREEFERFTLWLDRLAFVGMRESVAYGLWSLSFSTLYRFTQVFAVLLGGMSILSGSVSAEQLTKYVLYCEWLIYAAWRLQNSMASLLQSIGACEKVFQFMHLPQGHQFLSGGVKLQRMTGSVDFVNISFHYSSRERVPFYITNIIKCPTIPCAISKAAVAAYAHEFISALPNGYDTIVDDNLLSGGQKQRIAIARAFLRDPIILVLDEATSALDAESEGHIKEILHSFKKDLKAQRTVIVIAQRLSTIKAADRILVMDDDGQVAEIGDHEKLLGTSGLYAPLIKISMDATDLDKKEGPVD